MKRNKTWKKPKEQSLICGYCEWCKKMLMSDAGGWIVTANKQRFCHDGKDGSCFDNYCERKLEEKQYANGRKKEVQLYKGWQEKSKSIRKEKRYENEIER